MREWKKFTLAILSLTIILTALILYLLVLPKHKPNFILITLDTQRADYIGAYSSINALTPCIDSLSEKGILFENCYSLIPITLPAHASIFYSQPPHKLNIYNNGEIFNGEGKISLAEIFKDKGYLTGAFVSLGVLTARYGLKNGFDSYYDKFPESRWYLTAEEVNSRVFPWLEENKDQKFFLWIHYSDPHDPYAPPYLPPNFRIYLNDLLLKEFHLKNSNIYYLNLNLKKGENTLKFEVLNDFPIKKKGYEFRARLTSIEFSNSENLKINFEKGWLVEKRKKVIYFMRKEAVIKLFNSEDKREIEVKIEGKINLLPSEQIDLYRKEVEYVDNEIGKLIDKLQNLNLFDKTYIILVGDHGEGLGEYKTAWGGPHFGHIHFLYNVYLKVPLIIYNPSSKEKGIRISEPVTILDIAPTILDLMGWKKSSQMQGQSLLKIKKKYQSEIYAQTYTPESYYDRFSIMKFPWHLISTPKKKEYELFNLSIDPSETENIYHQNKFKKEIIQLKEKLDAFIKQALLNKVEKKKDNQTLEMLKSLGYIK
ncbi:MAG: sulfatase [Candidatus Aminicenantia bacterium]